MAKDKGSRFEVEDGVLRVKSDLHRYMESDFVGLCDELITSSKDEVVIDLSKVRFVLSTFIGNIAVAQLKAQQAGKTLKIRVSGPLEKQFRGILGDLVEFEQVETPESDGPERSEAP